MGPSLVVWPLRRQVSANGALPLVTQAPRWALSEAPSSGPEAIERASEGYLGAQGVNVGAAALSQPVSRTLFRLAGALNINLRALLDGIREDHDTRWGHLQDSARTREYPLCPRGVADKYRADGQFSDHRGMSRTHAEGAFRARRPQGLDVAIEADAVLGYDLKAIGGWHLVRLSRPLWRLLLRLR